MLPSLLALDLDGTVLPGKRGVPAAHRAVIEAYSAQGCCVAIATGRPLLTAQPVWDELNLDSWLVCFNGVWVVDPHGEVRHDASLSAAEARQVIDAIGDSAGTLCVYPDASTWIIDHFTAATAGWADGYAVPIHTQADLRQAWHGTTAKVMFVSDPPAVTALEQRLRTCLGQQFHLVISEPDRLEIHAAHATKAWGLEQVAAAMGISAAQVWAVGDGRNDVEMLRWAGRSFAMGQASPAVQAAATDVLPPVHEHGLAALAAFLPESID